MNTLEVHRLKQKFETLKKLVELITQRASKRLLSNRVTFFQTKREPLNVSMVNS